MTSKVIYPGYIFSFVCFISASLSIDYQKDYWWQAKNISICWFWSSKRWMDKTDGNLQISVELRHGNNDWPALPHHLSPFPRRELSENSNQSPPNPPFWSLFPLENWVWVELTVRSVFMTLLLRNHCEIFSLGPTGCNIEAYFKFAYD